jgi:signal transduction histidine kinase
VNITQKGIVLVLVPLTLQLAVVCFLLQQLHVFNQARLRELQAKRAAALALEIGFLGGTMGGAVYMYALMGHQEFLDTYRAGAQLQATKLRELEPIVAKRFPGDRLLPAFEQRLAEAAGLNEAFISEVAGGPSNRIPAMLRYATRFFAQMLHSMDDVDRMSSTFNEAAARQSALVAPLWEREKMIIWGGIAASVVLTVLMSLFFARGVTGRIELVKANTRLLAEGKPLAASLGGKDEVSQLDFFFHDMADRLGAAAQFKRDFYAMISHDLRNPLASVKMLLEMLGMGAYGQLEDPAQESVETALAGLDELLSLINDILDLEKLDAGQMPLVLDTVEFPEVLTETLELLAAKEPGSSGQIVWSCPALKISADRDRLKRALLAFLASAAALSKKQTVSVTVESDGSLLKININFRPDRKNSLLSVPAGLAGAAGRIDLPGRLFASGEATGAASAVSGSASAEIGLRLGKMVVELHGGNLNLQEDAANSASCLTVSLPVRSPT